MAFAYFAQAELDIAVLEVGMGGRLDATNVVDPVVSVITPIDIDHVDALGNTLEEIAGEKAGIIKPAKPVVMGYQKPSAEAVIRNVAASVGAPLVDTQAEIRTTRSSVQPDADVCSFHGRDICIDDVRLRLVGAHQTDNAATAVAVARSLRDAGWPLSDGAIRDGLQQARIHCRFQVVQLPDGRRCVLDAAHTPGSGAALGRTLREALSGEPITLIVGMSSDKDAGGFAQALAPVASHVVLSRAESNPRAFDPDRLAALFSPYCESLSVEQSLSAAVANAPGGAVCVTGSVYIVGDALRTIAPDAYSEFRREVGL
jgi:dihydrofolate synthase/folylpolyglutamate synthase